MRFVKLTRIENGEPSRFLDPDDYLRVLPELAPRLPGGARAFITDPGHFDFTGTRCVKDLRVTSIEVVEAGSAQVALEIRFEGNRWKHGEDLTIRYQGVTRFHLDVDLLSASVRVWPESPRLGDLQLDEVLPIANGCSHEMSLTGGTVLVECADLEARWIGRADGDGG